MAPSTSRVMPSTRTDANLVTSRTETFVLPREAAGVQPALRDWAEARVHIKVVDAVGDSPTVTLESDVRSERVVLTIEEAVGLLSYLTPSEIPPAMRGSMHGQGCRVDV